VETLKDTEKEEKGGGWQVQCVELHLCSYVICVGTAVPYC